MRKWIAEFELEDGDTMPEHMNLEYKGAKIDFHCRPMWIPCSEKLPSDYVLFCDLDGDVYYGHRMDNKWWAEGCDDRIKNVIAWMPRPESYKDGEQHE